MLDQLAAGVRKLKLRLHSRHSPPALSVAEAALLHTSDFRRLTSDLWLLTSSPAKPDESRRSPTTAGQRRMSSVFSHFNRPVRALIGSRS